MTHKETRNVYPQDETHHEVERNIRGEMLHMIQLRGIEPKVGNACGTNGVGYKCARRRESDRSEP